jgi:hypothetical protein
MIIFRALREMKVEFLEVKQAGKGPLARKRGVHPSSYITKGDERNQPSLQRDRRRQAGFPSIFVDEFLNIVHYLFATPESPPQSTHIPHQ